MSEVSPCDLTHDKKCPPLQRHIRSRSWPLVMSQIRKDPSQICQHNRVGWSSLILAIYHSAPPEIIRKMISLVSSDDRRILLSTPVPNGSRVCLHFATRFSSSLEVIQLLTESYPRALVVKSTDGVTPLDRAIYYRKDNEILSWLEAATRQEQMLYEKEVYNKKLRDLIVKCCESRWAEIRDNSDIGEEFFVQVYGYAREREMIGLFWNVLSYVGVHTMPEGFSSCAENRF
jgi:hypothetical protein